MVPEPQAHNTFDSLEGHLLVAAPRMDDPVFARSVILVLQHSEMGAIGIMLNRPVDMAGALPESVTQLVAHLEAAGQSRSQLRIGGPVAGPLIGLAATTTNRAEERVYYIEHEAALRRMSNETPDGCQFFVGHTAWSEGQLDEELAAGDWLKVAVDANFLRTDCQQMWVSALREGGRAVYRDVLGIRAFPYDAALN